METILAWLNTNPWGWVAITIGIRGLIKWNQAGKPRGIAGLIQSIISFVPKPDEPHTDLVPDTKPENTIDLIRTIIGLISQVRRSDPHKAEALEGLLKSEIGPLVMDQMIFDAKNQT